MLRLAERMLHEGLLNQIIEAVTPRSMFIGETLRLDMARTLLSRGLPLKSEAAQVGLSPVARLTDAFEHRFGVAHAFIVTCIPNYRVRRMPVLLRAVFLL